MAVDTSVIGKPTGAHTVRIERGPVSFFTSLMKAVIWIGLDM